MYIMNMVFRRHSKIDKRTFNSIIMLVTSLFIVFFAMVGKDNQEWELLVSGLNYPDGPAWNASNETLYFSNSYSNWIGRYSYGHIDTLVSSKVLGFRKSSGLTFDNAGVLLICDFSQKAILEMPRSGLINTLVSEYNGEKFNHPSDIINDSKGNIFFTDANRKNNDILDGRVFYFDRTKNIVMLVADKLAFPKGLEISPLDGRLYISESAKSRIVSYGINKDGILSDKQSFISLPDGEPSGIEFDVRGNLYVTHFGTGVLYVINPEGRIIRQIKTPGNKPTNLEFGDADFKTLYLTEVETNSLYKRRMKIAGAKINE